MTRVARAHGFQRNGAKIEERVLTAIGKEIPRITEAGGKVVYWRPDAAPAPVVPLRHADPRERSPAVIPLAELAGLAHEFLAPDQDDAAIMERMKEHFGLGKLREPTRKRFAAAVRLAREHVG